MIFSFNEEQALDPQTILPNGCSEIYYSKGTEKLWLDFLNSCEEFGKWSIERLNEQIIDKLVDRGGILILESNSVVACASICDYETNQPFATLMYVIVKKQYRNMGLGKYLTKRALILAKLQGFPGLVLRTDDFRNSAIKMYKNVGFAFDEKCGLYSIEKWNNLIKTIENNS